LPHDISYSIYWWLTHANFPLRYIYIQYIYGWICLRLVYPQIHWIIIMFRHTHLPASGLKAPDLLCYNATMRVPSSNQRNGTDTSAVGENRVGQTVRVYHFCVHKQYVYIYICIYLHIQNIYIQNINIYSEYIYTVYIYSIYIYTQYIYMQYIYIYRNVYIYKRAHMYIYIHIQTMYTYKSNIDDFNGICFGANHL
jgi:hypothetical protein